MEYILLKLARTLRYHAGAKKQIYQWYGMKVVENRRKYVCYICNHVISSECDRFNYVSKYVTKAIKRHGEEHMESPLIPFM